MAQALKKLILSGTFLLLFAFGLKPNVTHAASLLFVPSTGTFTAGTPFSIVAALNTSGVIANALDASITFSKDILSVSSISTTGSAVTLWVTSPTYSNTDGTIIFTGGQPRPGFNGSAVALVTITFLPKTAGTATINYTGLSVLSGDGLATELLTGLGSATYNINPAPPPPPPPADTQAPKVSWPTPPNGVSRVPLDSDVLFRITDNSSGVNLSTLTVNINGIIYSQGGPNPLSAVGIPTDYTVTVSHATPWPADTLITVKVNAKDIAGNTMSPYSWSFNKFVVVPALPPPPVDTQAPKVSWPTPPNAVTGVPLDSDLSFRITDDISGVDLNTLVVNINGTDYSGGAVSPVGSPTDYTVTVSHVALWPADTQITVRINAKDIVGNTMSPYQWYFNRPPPTPPPVVAPPPAPAPTPIVCPTPGDFIPSTATLPDTPVEAVIAAIIPNISLPTTPAQVIPAITAVPGEIQASVSNAVTVVKGSILTGVAGFLRPTVATKPVIDAQGNIECPASPRTATEIATEKSNWLIGYALFFIGLIIGALFKELFITHKLKDKKATERAPLTTVQPQAQPYNQSIPR